MSAGAMIDIAPAVSPRAVRLPIRWPASRAAVEAAAPVSFGVEIPRGEALAGWRCHLETPDGIELPAQCEVLGASHDRSTVWLLVDAVMPVGTRLSRTWNVVLQPTREPENNGTSTMRTMRRGDSIVVQCEPFEARFNRDGSWSMEGRESVTSISLPQLTDSAGREHLPLVQTMKLLAAGPVRTTIQYLAEFPQVGGLRLIVRWNVYAECGLVTADITLHNPRRARHRDGLWDLGDSGSMLFRDLSVPIDMSGATPAVVSYRCEASDDWANAATGQVEIYQESSGGENWNSHNHLNRLGIVTLKFCGYRGQAGEVSCSGRRASPELDISVGRDRLAVAIDDFWQQFPKAIEAHDGRIALRLFPRQFGDLHELQGGEQKTHRIALKFDRGTGQCGSLSVHVPQPVSLNRAAAIAGLPSWEGADGRVLSRLDALAEEFLTGPRGLFANRELVDEFGWRNYGDIHADHEAQHYRGRQPLISHYNNQFDLLCGCLLQYLRTADERWMQVASPLARHVIDIDIYHTTEDRPAYSGGMFWFTDHYLHAETSTHRTYSRTNRPAGGGPYGGGPGACHVFSTGLLLYHLMTGYTPAREAVISLADWVIAMDEGSRTVLGLVDDGPTGLASATGLAAEHGPGRGAGNSINALLDGWQISNDRRYLDYAETLIRRCIHPSDDVAARNLLDAEQHWSYTVFLVSLAKYLACKADAGELDRMYGYAQQSLLHYGRWMLQHERPYFDRRDELEYPTEAWAAQELRKANVLRLAAQHAGEPLRSRMFDRGDEVAQRAWCDLDGFSTRTTARAMAVVLTEAVRDAELRCRDPLTTERVDHFEFEPPEQFVPQRERVKQKLRSPRGLASLLVTAANPVRWPRAFNHR